MGHGLPGGLELLLAHPGLLAADSPLGHGQDGEALAALLAALYGLGDLLRGVGDLGNDDHVGAGGDAGVQGQPSGLVAHDLHDEHPGVGEGGGVDGVDDRHGDVHGGLEAEGHLRAPQVVVDGLGQGDHVDAVLAEEVGGLVGAVAPQDHQTVEPGLLHRGQHLLQLGLLAVVPGLGHLLEGLAGGAKDGAAQGEDVGKVPGLHLVVVPLDKTPVAVPDAIDGHLVAKLVVEGLGHAPQGGIQALAVAAAGEHPDLHALVLLFDHTMIW